MDNSLKSSVHLTMKTIWLLVAVAILIPPVSRAEYGPLLVRTIPSIAERACKEAAFTQSESIVQALHSGELSEIESVIEGPLKEFQATPRGASGYPARAFCIHQLVPYALPHAAGPISAHAGKITSDVTRFRALGIIYDYYDPDDLWKLRKGPVDLNDLAENYLSSPWGREAFLMMTLLGWSQGACREGPDQFREVIKRGEEFLPRFPNSEVSPEIRLELGEAYTTWWALSLDDSNDGVDRSKYQAGAEQARTKATALFRQALNEKPAQQSEIRKRLAALQQHNAQGLPFRYYCADYED
jgi:hypothetical protein